MGAAARQSVPWRLLLTVMMVLALVMAMAPAAPVAAQEENNDDGDAGADDAPVAPEANDRLSIADFPGVVGQLIQQLGDGKVPSLRYRGAQRYDTARMIALDAFDNPADVIIARGDLFPDALSGSFLAGQRDAPLLLTSNNRLEPDTMEALDDLDPNRVTLVGGTAAIASSVAGELGRLGYPTNRIGGFDRFETARMIATSDATEVGEREGHGRTAIVARADEFADALVAGTLSFTADYPLLLTTHDGLHPDAAAALDELDIEHVIVPGGSAAVGDDVVGEMEASGLDVERVSGVDRVATSVEFAQFMREELGFGLDRINTAIGTRFPDALAMGPLSGDRGQPIVLTADEDTLGGDGAVEEFLSQTCSIDVAGLGGGHAAITTELEDHMRDIATSTGAPCLLSLLPDLEFLGLGDQHTLESTLTDNAQTPLAGEDVRVDVFRATNLPVDDIDVDSVTGAVDLSNGELGSTTRLEDIVAALEETLAGELDLDTLDFGSDPVESFVETTDSDGEIDVDYTGPDSPALDIAVACLDAESEQCALVEGGQVEPDEDLLTSSAIAVWGLDVLVPNLLLVDPPLGIETSGTGVTREVTATALLADLDSLDDLGGIPTILSGVLGDPLALLDTVLDPGNLQDLGGVLELGALLRLEEIGVIDAAGTRVGNTPVRFEAYRATDLIEALLGSTLDDLLELDGLLDGTANPDDLLGGLLDAGLLDGGLAGAGTLDAGDDPAARAALLDDLPLEDLLGGLLENLSVSELDGLGVAPVSTGTGITDSNGEATFEYGGPDGIIPGLDVIVACFGDEDDTCTTLLDGTLDLPSNLGIGLGAAIWLPSVLDSLDPLLDVGLLGGGGAGILDDSATVSAEGDEHTIDASALRADGAAADGVPVRWDVYRTGVDDLLQLGLLEDLVGSLDLESLVGDTVGGLLADGDLLDLDVLNSLLGEAGPDVLDLELLEGALSEELSGVLGSASTQGDTAQVLVDEGAIEDALASLDLNDFIAGDDLLGDVPLLDVVDSGALTDGLVDELLGTVLGQLEGLGIADLLDAVNLNDLMGVANHVTGGVETTDDAGHTPITYGGDDAPTSAAVDLVVSCLGHERDDCSVLGNGGSALEGLNPSGLNIPLVSTKVWLDGDLLGTLLGDLLDAGVLNDALGGLDVLDVLGEGDVLQLLTLQDLLDQGILDDQQFAEMLVQELDALGIELESLEAFEDLLVGLGVDLDDVDLSDIPLLGDIIGGLPLP